jgi:hypothetical protein
MHAGDSGPRTPVKKPLFRKQAQGHTPFRSGPGRNFPPGIRTLNFSCILSFLATKLTYSRIDGIRAERLARGRSEYAV